MRKPCSNCPWRKDAPREYWDPKHLTDIYVTCQDDGDHLMLCHKTKRPGKSKLICQGWIRVIGRNAVGVRIALLRDYVTLEEVEDVTMQTGLFATFEAMLTANRIDIPPRNRLRP